MRKVVAVLCSAPHIRELAIRRVGLWPPAQCTQDGIGLPEAERLFQRLDSGRPDAREPPRLPDPLLDGAGETDGAAGGGFTKEEFIAQCMRDGVERRMAERMFAALDEQNTGFGPPAVQTRECAAPCPSVTSELSEGGVGPNIPQ